MGIMNKLGWNPVDEKVLNKRLKNKERASKVCELLAKHKDFVATERFTINFKTGVTYLADYGGLCMGMVEGYPSFGKEGRHIQTLEDLNKVLEAYDIRERVS